MIRQIRSAREIEKPSQGQQMIQEAFDYTPLTPDIAAQVQTAAQRIRQMVQRTLEDLLAAGKDLLAVNAALPHGRFGPWLRAEFGWTERTARRFMTVAERFGPKTDTMSDLPFDPTAAYLLAAPSAPEEASSVALERAENGERITFSVAKEILGKLRNKPGRRTRRLSHLPDGKLLGQLLESLESFRQRWDPRQVSVLARQLREFADSLEDEHAGKETAGEK
jgi:hypothetical protein